MWWDILKNAELDSKSKYTLDTSRIKINTDDNNCKKKLRYYYNNPKVEKQRLQLKQGNMKFDITGMSEDTACKIVNWIEALPIFPVRNEMLDFFETTIDGYFIEIMLEREWKEDTTLKDTTSWYLSLEISYSGKTLVELFLIQQEGEKPESIDWRK
tara:strand:- start:1 stop:468 length:468 start_codon:yes stop_codon:yes gene_type:complete